MLYENHPAAALFPMMADGELRNLAADIKENGLLEPVVLYHGQVLDGRNRLAACGIAEVEPRYTEVNGEVPSPTLYALSKNLHRRHLSTSQRAAIAAELIPLLAEEAKVRQLSGLTNQAHSSLVPDDTDERGRSRTIAAELLGIGETSVVRAISAKRYNPEGFEKVKRGELTVSAAADGYTEQPQRGGVMPASLKTQRGQQVAEKQKARMISAISAATGMCSGLETADISILKSVLDQQEIQLWARKAREVAKGFRDFAAQLERT